MLRDEAPESLGNGAVEVPPFTVSVTFEDCDHFLPRQTLLPITLAQVALVCSRVRQSRADEVAGAAARQDARYSHSSRMKRPQRLVIGRWCEIRG